MDPLIAAYERHTLIKREDVPELQRVKIIVGRFTENDLRHRGCQRSCCAGTAV